MIANIDYKQENSNYTRKLAIRRRLATDYLYYAPRCHKIIDKNGRLIPFKLNEAQKYIHAIFEKELKERGYIRAIMLKARQFGGSTLVESWFYHKVSHKKGKRAVIMTEADMSRDNLFNMVKTFHENAPASVRPHTKNSNEKALIFDTSRESELKGLKSRYDVKTCDSKGGLGITTHFIHLSEYAFFKDAALNTVAGLLESVPSEYPAILGTQVIIESTANGTGGIFYNRWKASEKEEAEGKRPEYTRIFIPWFFHTEYQLDITPHQLMEIKKTITEEEEWLLKQTKPDGSYVTYQQLAWRRWKIRSGEAPVGYTKEEYFKQWYPATADEAFIYSGKAIFPASQLNLAIEECYSHKFVGDFNMHNGRFENDLKGKIKIWEKPKIDGKYVIGADVSEGLQHGDFDSADVLKLPYGQQVAHLHGKMDPDTYGEVLNLLGRYYNIALLGVECNNHGHATIGKLKHLGYPNLYQREALDSNADGKKVKKAGWLTTRNSKYKIVDGLRGALRDQETGIACVDTVIEMGNFVVKDDNGQYGAKLGCFDDRVMSYCIAYEMVNTVPQAREERDEAVRRSRKRRSLSGV